MNGYFFYQGNNSEYVNIMRDKFGLLPSFKGKSKVVAKIGLMSRLRDFCRNDIGTSYLTAEIARHEPITVYIEDNAQTILGAIVFHLDNIRGNDIYISAFCTPVSNGIGTKLMNYVIEFGKLTGFSVIKLSASYPAVSFYRKKGFKMTYREEKQLYADITELNPLPSAADRRISNQQSSSDFSRGLPPPSSIRSSLVLPDGVDSSDLYFSMKFVYATDYVSKKTRVKTPKQRSASQYVKKIKSNTRTRKYRSL